MNLNAISGGGRLVAARSIRPGDLVLIDERWHVVLDTWANNGFVQAVAQETVGMFRADEQVPVRRSRP